MKRQYETYRSGNYHRIRELGPHAQIDINTDMLQALQQRHHADHEANHPHVNGHIFSCPFKSIFVIENQILDRNKECERTWIPPVKGKPPNLQQ
jgi:hypothetical protein